MRFFTTICHHVSTQIMSFRGCIVAQIAFVALFAILCFQMTLQMTKSGRCILYSHTGRSCLIFLSVLNMSVLNMHFKNIGP